MPRDKFYTNCSNNVISKLVFAFSEEKQSFKNFLPIDYKF